MLAFLKLLVGWKGQASTKHPYDKCAIKFGAGRREQGAPKAPMGGSDSGV